jgi:hypothetical protein
MKRFFLLALVGLLALNVALAGNAYNKGENTAQVGLGIGLAGLYGTSDLPPITLGLDFGIEQKISVGAIGGYSSSKEGPFPWYGGTYEWKYTYIIVGGRGAYHFLENNEKIDAYGGITLGYNIVSVKTTLTGTTTPITAGASGSYMLYGGFLGGKYYFSKGFGIYAEAGYGVGYINGGIVFKF